MNNTIPNVPCELLETLIEQHITAHGFTNHTARQAQLILCAPSPAGVDGLEVAGYVSQDDIKWQGDCTLRIKPYSDYTIPLCRLSDAAAIIDGLRGEVERLSSQKADWVERATSLGHRADQLSQRIGELERLLREWRRMFDGGLASGQLGVLRGQTDATLSAGKEGE